MKFLRDRAPLVLVLLVALVASARAGASLSTYLDLDETAAPSLSGAGVVRLYASSSGHNVQVSANGGAYSTAITASNLAANLPATVVVDGGNTTGATVTVGTNDVQSLALESSGTTRVTLTATTLTSTLPITLPVGSTTTASVNFASDPNTGVYSPGADQVAIVTGGTARFTLSTSAMTTTLPARGQDGTVSAPAFSFSGDTNVGMYRIGTDNLGFATAGVERLQISSAGLLLANGATSFGTVGINNGSGTLTMTFTSVRNDGSSAAGTQLRPDLTNYTSEFLMSPNGTPTTDTGFGVGAYGGEIAVYGQDSSTGGTKTLLIMQSGATGIALSSMTTNSATPSVPFLISGYDSSTVTRTDMMGIDPGLNEITVGKNGSVKLGFFNATPISKPTVTGSRGGNAALADLLNELQSLGLITNSSS